jgi:hypothetical protein
MFIILVTKPPYNQWRIEQFAIEGCSNTQYLGRIVFDRSLLPPYIPRKALDKKSFPTHDACTYVFGSTTINSSPSENKANVNAIDEKSNDDDGLLLTIPQLATKIVRVTPNLIAYIRSTLLQNR